MSLYDLAPQPSPAPPREAAPPIEHYLYGEDGIPIFTRHWRPAGEPVAAVVLCHGVRSHSGHLLWSAGQFASAGCAVTALDLRGRGLSGGDRYSIEGIADYVTDLRLAIDLARIHDPGLSIFLLGHSAGGVTACSLALDHQDEVDGLICVSFALHVYAPEHAPIALNGISHVAPHFHFLYLKNDDLSRDPEWVRRLDSDPLTAGEHQPVQTVAAFARAGDRLAAKYNRITLPVLIVHGTADETPRPDGRRLFFTDDRSSNQQIRLYAGHHHDLLNDYGRERVMADILDWIAHQGRRTSSIGVAWTRQRVD